MKNNKQVVHKRYCDYEISKANANRTKSNRIYSVKEKPNSQTKGIKTSGLSKAMLARELALLIN